MSPKLRYDILQMKTIFVRGYLAHPLGRHVFAKPQNNNYRCAFDACIQYLSTVDINKIGGFYNQFYCSKIRRPL